MAGRKPSFDELTRMAGTELGVSSWICVDQSMIDQFAETTRDRQWIHIDVERAQRESPYKAPVAHGYLTLSLVAAMSYEIGAMPEGTVAAVNYGLRFLAPVRAGANIRMRSRLILFESKGERRYLMKCHNVVEIEGEEQAALVADTLALLVAAPDAA